MLNFQQKINDLGQPTAFNDTQHDAEEFNSSHNELKNFIEAARLTPTALGSFGSDDITQMTQAGVVYSGLMLEDNTVGGSPNDRILDPFVTSPVLDLPPIAAMDNFSFKFRAKVANTGACTMTAFGVGSSLLLMDGSAVPPGYIRPDGIYLCIRSLGAFLITALSPDSISQNDYAPNGTTNVPQSTDEENASFSTNGDIIHISGFLKWDTISGSPINASFDLPQINGQQVQFKSTSILPSVTIRLPIDVIVDGVSETNYMLLTNGPSNPAVVFTTPASSLFISLNFSFPFELV